LETIKLEGKREKERKSALERFKVQGSIKSKNSVLSNWGAGDQLLETIREGKKVNPPRGVARCDPQFELVWGGTLRPRTESLRVRIYNPGNTSGQIEKTVSGEYSMTYSSSRKKKNSLWGGVTEKIAD